MKKLIGKIKKIFTLDFWQDALAAVLRPAFLLFFRPKYVLEKIRNFSFKKSVRWMLATKTRKVAASLLIAVLMLGPLWGVVFRNQTQAAWWNDMWKYRKKITIDHTKVAGELQNFPILVSLTDTNLKDNAQADGDDIVFADANGQKLSHEIESYISGTGALIAWVKIPFLTNARDQDIYIYYGNSTATSQQDSENVWDANFKMVQHMSQDPSGTAPQMTDSTSNNNDGTSNGTMLTEDLVDAKIGKGLDFDGGDDYVSVADAASIRDLPEGAFSFSAWTTLGEIIEEKFIFSKAQNTSTNGWSFYFDPYGRVRVLIRQADTNLVTSTPDSSFSDNSTVHFAMSFSGGDDASAVKIYINGNEVSGLTYQNGAGAYQSDSGHEGRIGRSNWNNYFNDIIDELKLSSSVRSSQWIATEYANQNDPAAFLSISSTQEDRPGGPVGYWSFDEGQGATAHDDSGQSNDGAITGAVWKPESECVSGKCLSFDGTSSYITIPDTPSLSSSVQTFSLWFNTKDLNDNRTLIGNNNNLSFNLPGLVRLNSSKIQYYSNSYTVSTNKVFSANTWYHLSIIADSNANTVDFYVNGTLDSSNNVGDITSLSDAYPYSIGAWSNNNSTYTQFWNGSIDEPKIYPYARSADQIKQDYNAGLASQSALQGASAAFGSESTKWMTDGLVGHWKMDETSGTTVADASGNGNTGTLTNAQETGTGEAAGTTTIMADDDNATLSTVDDAYNGMILRVTGGGGCGISTGTERIISDYDYEATPTRRVTVDTAFSAETDSCTFEIRHQAGGKFGNSIGSDGVNDDIIVTSAPELNFGQNSFTLNTWFKSNQLNSSWSYFFDKEIANWNSGYGFGHYLNGRLVGSVCGGSWANSISVLSPSSPAYNDNRWHQATFILNAEEKRVKMYVDGQQITLSKNSGCGTIRGKELDITSCTSATATATADLDIGGTTWSHESIRSFIDETRIYNRALSADEVAKLYEWAPGPVGHWKMDDNVSGNAQTLTDISTFGNNGTTDDGANNTGMDCTVQGKFGKGCEFDGDDYVTTGKDIADGLSQVTLCAWAKPNEADIPSYRWIAREDGSIRLYKQGTQYVFSVYGVLGSASNAYSSSHNDTNWHYVCGIYDGAYVRVYVDGVSEDATPNPLTGPIFTDSSDFVISTSTNPWYGQIDDVRIYNYARTQKQILQDMEGASAGASASQGALAKPIAHYDFNEGYGSTAHNKGIGTSIDGTLNAGGSGGNTTNTAMWDKNGKNGKGVELDGDDYISLPDFGY